MRSTSLLTLPVLLSWLAGSAYGHAIRRTSLVSPSDEPLFTIQTSMPSTSTITPSGTAKCSANGSSFLCPTSASTATDSGIEEPVFCPAPTSLPSGLCYTTVTYTILPTPTTFNGTVSPTTSVSAGFSSANATTTTGIRMYPCEERTTIYSSTTYAINCLDDESNYIACPTNLTVTPVRSSKATSDCTNETGSTISCRSSATSSTTRTACIDGGCPNTTTTSPTRTTAPSISSTFSPGIISQCFNQSGAAVLCPTICSEPFETAPGPVIPTASLSLEEPSSIQESSDTSEKIFQTTPAPVITSFASAPAFLTSGLAGGK